MRAPRVFADQLVDDHPGAVALDDALGDAEVQLAHGVGIGQRGGREGAGLQRDGERASPRSEHGVEPISRHLVHECLSSLREAGSMIVYTTHYLEEAERLCERIAIIDHGRLVVCADRDELVSGTVRLEDRFLELTGRELRD